MLYLRLFLSRSLSLLSTPRFYLPADRRGLFSVLGIAVRRTDPLLLSLGVRTVAPEITDVIPRVRRASSISLARPASASYVRVSSPDRGAAFAERTRRNVDVLSDRGQRDGQRNDAIYVQVRIQGWKPSSRRLVSHRASVPRCSLHAHVAEPLFLPRASPSYPTPSFSFYITFFPSLSSYLFFFTVESHDSSAPIRFESSYVRRHRCLPILY